MITRIEALNYRCFKYMSCDLNRFQILAGPNASGKSTFLDMIQFLSDLLKSGNVYEAIRVRASHLEEILWMKQGSSFEIAIEASIPGHIRKLLGSSQYNLCRYEIRVGTDSGTGEYIIDSESILLIEKSLSAPQRREIFPRPVVSLPSVITAQSPAGCKRIISKTASSKKDNYYEEVNSGGRRWNTSFKLGSRKSTLANLPEDETKFPVSTWFKELIQIGVNKIALNSELLRNPSPPGKSSDFLPDGSNLPWLVQSLQRKDQKRFKWWMEHIRTVLKDIKKIETVERPEDKHRYLVLHYDNGLKIPSWLVSDGTLRFLALTLLAYLPDLWGVFLVEEPENGIHPRGVKALFDSLSSTYDAQVLLASHSPIFLNIARPEHILCFGKTDEGEVDVVNGKNHPVLSLWKGETNLGTLFASGILG